MSSFVEFLFWTAAGRGALIFFDFFDFFSHESQRNRRVFDFRKS